MVKNKKFKLILFSFFSLAGCALQLPPSGGDIDLIPPVIVSTYPVNGATNYKENFFRFTFSEYVDKRSFKEALFISPATQGEMNINWSGRSVEVYFSEGFRYNTTYIINIGTDVVDLNNRNRMARSFILTFSTGDKIDDKIISGKVFDANVDGTMIFAYKFIHDTSNYLINKPDYISQCGKDGTFEVRGLPEGTFRIFAVKDQFRDLIFNAEQDMIGIPFDDISINKLDSLISGLNFYLTKHDTLPPRIIDARMLDNKHILLKFSEEIDLSLINQTDVKVVDNSLNLISKSTYKFNPLNKTDELIIIPDDSIKSETDLFIIADGIKDKYGNISNNEKIGFIYSDKIDTSAPKILQVEPSSMKIDFLNPSIKIYFDDALISDKISEAISFLDLSGNKLQLSIKKINDALIEVSPQNSLKPDTKYKMELKMNLLPDAAGNSLDTTIFYNFVTKNEFDFSGLSGQIKSTSKNLILVLESINQPDIKYSLNVKNENFSFERILPDKYRLWAFEDRNQNGKYDYGSIIPLEYAERFYYYEETIEVKPRWSITDIKFHIK
jgi:hypothetical protein